MKSFIKIITISAFAAFITTSVFAHCGACDSGEAESHSHMKEAKKMSMNAFPDVSHDDLKTMIAEGSVFIIDVNGTTSYKKGHIPGAVNYASVQSELEKILPENKDTLIVAYCGGPSCAAYKKAAKAVAALGYTNVQHYSGGISGWKSSGEAIEKA